MTQTEQPKKKTPDFNNMVSMKTGKPKNQQTEQLFRKVFIEGKEENLPKESGDYFVEYKAKKYCISRTRNSLDYDLTLPEKDKHRMQTWWLKNIDWYLLPINSVPPKRLNDEEIIDTALDYVLHRNLHHANKGLIKDAIIIGMKKARDFYESK